MKTRLFPILLLLVTLQLAIADDFKTIEGKEYKNAKVSRVEPDGIVITFSGGIVKLPFTELSPEIQKKYGYDPKAAEDFQQQTYQGDVVKARQLGEAREKRQQELEALSKSQLQPTTPVPAERQSVIRVGQNIPVYTLQQLEVDQFSLIGKIIGVRFNYLGSYTRRSTDGSYEGEIHRSDRSSTTRTTQFAEIDVVVPENAIGWFQNLPTSYSRARDTFVYAEVIENRGRAALRLIGSQIRRDMSGNGAVTW